jgi:hypothetical protein
VALVVIRHQGAPCLIVHKGRWALWKGRFMARHDMSVKHNNVEPTYRYDGGKNLSLSAALRSHPVRVFTDPWRSNAERILRYRGRCLGCGYTLWEFDDGYNDPRGFLGDHAAHHLEEDGEPAILACAICANDYNSYNAIMASAGRDSH